MVPSLRSDLIASALPDSPGAAAAETRADPGSSSSLSPDLPDPAPQTGPGTPLPRRSSPTEMTVAAGQVAPKQTVHDKLVGSAIDSVTPFTFAGELISAGYSHLTNGSPNYGTDSPAFAQRFGAAVARGTSQNLFAEGAMAAILHEDPRYYQMGNRANVIKRAAYAATRPLITRTDSGRTTPNIALLSGYLGAAALTQVYYPAPNQGFSQVMQTYGGSIGGAALGYVVSEFLPGVLEAVHLKKTE